MEDAACGIPDRKSCEARNCPQTLTTACGSSRQNAARPIWEGIHHSTSPNAQIGPRHALPRCEVKFVVETLSASPQQAVQGFSPAVHPAPRSDWAIALSIDVDADARRISQALTEPEYLEAWISMPDQSEGSSIVASKRANGYGLDHWRAGRVVTSIVGSFLSRHQRKMRLSWRNLCRPLSAESLVDFRIRGNFGSSVLELRQTAFISADDYLWHQTLWQRSLGSLALILRSM
jgi:hypothetical protein